MLFLALVEMAEAQGNPADAAKWADLAAKLGDFHAAPDGELKLDANQFLTESHRHLSNLIGVYPVQPDHHRRQRRRPPADPRQRGQVGQARAQPMVRLLVGLDELPARPRGRPGGRPPSLRCLRPCLRHPQRIPRQRRPDQERLLEHDLSAVHAGGQLHRHAGGPRNAAAKLEPHPGKRDTEVIRLFPATAWRWHDVSFTDLRAEGGHRVSAKRENNATTWFRITAGKDGIVRIRDNFGGRAPKWSPAAVVVRKADNFEFNSSGASRSRPPSTNPPPSRPPPPVPPSRWCARSSSTTLPLHLGADSDGGNRFVGDLARPLIVNRALTAAEIAKLAEPVCRLAANPGAVLAITGPPAAAQQVEKVETQPGMPAVPHSPARVISKFPHPALNCRAGLTLSLWVKPAATPGGARLIDKTKTGTAAGYLLDTWPGGTSLRLITREPALVAKDILPLDRWSHVAATVAADGHQPLYLNGKIVAESD